MNKLPKWEKAKSDRSRCRKCRILIPKFSKRLKVPQPQFYSHCDVFYFYCVSCASGVSLQPELEKEYSESVKKAIGFGQGRFYKHFRKIILGQ